MSVSRFSRWGLMAVVLLMAAAHSAFAQPQSPSASASPPVVAKPTLFNAGGKAPSIDSIPALKNLVSNGARLYYMGDRSGIHGWFIVKDKQVQMIYLSPDRQSVLIGALMSSLGENVTGEQVKYLVDTTPELSEMLSGAAKQQQEIKKAGEEGGVASVLADKAAVEAAPKDPLAANLPGVIVSPGERLMRDLKAAAGVTVGQNEESELVMLVAPSCPYCKATWGELRDSVKANKIQVRLVPVFITTGGVETKQAAQLLSVKDPLDAWDRFVAGDVSALAGEPSDTAIRAVIANLNMASKWNIQSYPYMVYRGKDGRIKIVQGKPERIASVLLDLSR